MGLNFHNHWNSETIFGNDLYSNITGIVKPNKTRKLIELNSWSAEEILKCFLTFDNTYFFPNSYRLHHYLIFQLTPFQIDGNSFRYGK